MLRRSLLGILIMLMGLTACQTGQIVGTPETLRTATPAPTVVLEPPATATPIPAEAAGLRTLLKFVSPQWIQMGNGTVLGTGLLYLDVAQIRKDLAIPPITGEDTSMAKSGLILGLNTQGFGSPLESISPGSFKKWGWDIADVERVLVFTDDYTTIIRGNFSRPAVKDRLLEQGYQAQPRGDYTVFTKQAKVFKDYTQFAVKDDTLIYGQNQGVIESLIDRQRDGKPGLDQEVNMQPLLDRLAGTWGAYLAPRGDMNDYKYWLEKNSLLATDQSTYKTWLDERIGREPFGVWEAVAIGWKGKSPTDVQFVYRYPTQQDATDDVELVRQALTQSPAFGFSMPWGKILGPVQVEAQGNLVIATTTTTKDTLLSRVIDDKEWGLLPIRFGTMPSLPQTTSGQTESTKSDAGWTIFSKEADGFSIELPSGWVSIDLNAQALEVTLSQLKKKNPQLADLVTAQARDAARSGLKLMAFSVPGSSEPQRFAMAAVIKPPGAIPLPLESIAVQLRNDFQKTPGLLGPIKLERLQLPAGDTRKLTMTLQFKTAADTQVDLTLTQYLLVNGDSLYSIAFYTADDAGGQLAATFQQIVEKFRFIK